MSQSSKTPDIKFDPDRSNVSDAVKGNWVDRKAPQWMRPYLRLSRADRPVGTWLLLIPCLWAIFLASTSINGSVSAGQQIWLIVSCSIGAFVMRGAGCSWNDIVDRNIDARVERTRSRPLPSGQLSTRQALVWMLIQAMIGAVILLSYNLFAIVVGFASGLLIIIYPFAKRFTWWPQAFLGLAFNWGALLLWVASSGKLMPAAFALYGSGFFWTLFYDTIYAHQDKEDDALIGVKSTARLFGQNTKKWLILFAALTSLSMFGAVFLAVAPLGDMIKLLVAMAGVLAMAGHFIWQIYKVDLNNSNSCLVIFRSNRDAGLLGALFFAGALFI